MDEIYCPRCEHEHTPSGDHESDSGDWECEACGFEFVVEIEYDPSYSSECKKHEWTDEPSLVSNGRGGHVLAYECKVCGNYRIAEGAT